MKKRQTEIDFPRYHDAKSRRRLRRFVRGGKAAYLNANA
jgi:hypothetical protein